jgi:hypothetical protein
MCNLMRHSIGFMIFHEYREDESKAHGDFGHSEGNCHQIRWCQVHRQVRDAYFRNVVV